MGRFVHVRGWIELVDGDQRPAADDVIERHRHPLYTDGWACPSGDVNGAAHLFYGGNVRLQDLDWFEAQVRELVALAPTEVDPGFVDEVTGFFLVTVEDGPAPSSWTIRHRMVIKTPAPDLAWMDA